MSGSRIPDQYSVPLQFHKSSKANNVRGIRLEADYSRKFVKISKDDRCLKHAVVISAKRETISRVSGPLGLAMNIALISPFLRFHSDVRPEAQLLRQIEFSDFWLVVRYPAVWHARALLPTRQWYRVLNCIISADSRPFLQRDKVIGLEKFVLRSYWEWFYCGLWDPE